MQELLLTFENRAALVDEFEKNLVHGRAFIANASGLAVFSACTLTIEHPDTKRRESFGCEVVMVLDQGAARGTGLQFVDRSGDSLARLRAFVAERAPAPATSRRPLATPFDDDEATGVLTTSGERRSLVQPAAPPPAASAPALDASAVHPYPDGPHELGDEHDDSDGEDLDEIDEQTNPFGASGADEHDPASPQHAVVAARAAKLRNLTPEQRIHYARSSVQEERVLLERIYTSAVWELLLHNPKITVPEVARMARKGSMPRPLLDFIVDNEQWIRHSLIRRALLGNPRLTGDSITKVLRALPPRELKLVPQQTAYPPSVRQAAARLMKG
jgi:hypothetical protein